jgi:hypothetical protein
MNAFKSLREQTTTITLVAAAALTVCSSHPLQVRVPSGVCDGADLYRSG